MKKLRWIFGAAVTTLVIAPWCNAQNAEFRYPSKPVRVVLPVAPGGGIDIVGRLVSAKLTDDFRQQFIADNRSGAAGMIGTDIVAKAPADGYTLLIVNSGLAYMPSLYPKLPYDVVNDLTGVSPIAATPSVLVLNPSVPAKSVKELIALMKAKPGQLNYGAAVGGTLHLAVALFDSTMLKQEVARWAKIIKATKIQGE